MIFCVQVERSFHIIRTVKEKSVRVKTKTGTYSNCIYIYTHMIRNIFKINIHDILQCLKYKTYFY